MSRFGAWAYLSTLFLFFGCAPDYRVPSEVQPYVDRFVEEAADRGVELQIKSLVIEFKESLADLGGVCHFGTRFEAPRIELNRDYWDGAQTWGATDDEVDAMRENALFHEMGHCVLDQGHRGWGLMQPVTHLPHTFIEYREIFLDELFGIEINKPPREGYSDEAQTLAGEPEGFLDSAALKTKGHASRWPLCSSRAE